MTTWEEIGNQLRDAVLVVAHPDDEILWFSSVLNDCKRVLVCFGPSATSKQIWDSGRAALMQNYPLAKVTFLKVRQSDAFETADWANPKESDWGLELRRGRTRSHYRENAEKLLSILNEELKHEKSIVTHNPWGEYGHEEHVQVFRVLSQLKDKLGFDLFVDSYVGSRSAGLLSRHLHTINGHPVVQETDRVLAHRLKNLYVDSNCWTWAHDYEWPEREAFYRVVGSAAEVDPETSASLPLNYITYDFDRGAVREIARRILPVSARSHIKRMFNQQ